MKPRINMNYLPLELRYDLGLLSETDVTYTAPPHTGGYGRYRTTFPWDIYDHLLRGTTCRAVVASEPPPVPYSEFICLVLGYQNHQTVVLLSIYSVSVRSLGLKSKPLVSHCPSREQCAGFVNAVPPHRGRSHAMQLRQNHATCTSLTTPKIYNISHDFRNLLITLSTIKLSIYRRRYFMPDKWTHMSFMWRILSILPVWIAIKYRLFVCNAIARTVSVTAGAPSTIWTHTARLAQSYVTK